MSDLFGDRTVELDGPDDHGMVYIYVTPKREHTPRCAASTCSVEARIDLDAHGKVIGIEIELPPEVHLP